MSSITNKWLTPFQRSFQQIRSKLIEAITSITDSEGNQLITDISEGNILIIILSLFASIAEVLHYYIDNTARETFLSSARRYDSVVKHGHLVDYDARSAVASTVDLVITRSYYSTDIGEVASIPRGTEFVDSAGRTWLSTRDVTWNANTTQCIIPVRQHVQVTASSLIGTVIPDGDSIIIPLGSIPNGMYEEGTMELSIGSVIWTLVKTFAYSGPTDKHFKVVVDQDNMPNIIFGDGIFGAKPTAGTYITGASYYVTTGSQGNIKSGDISMVPSDISEVVHDATCSNPYDASGGSDYEGFEKLKEHIPLHVRTQEVLITKQDVIDAAKLVPGVGKAALEYICGRRMNLYIAADNGVIASSTLRTLVYNTLRPYLPITTSLNVISAGQANIQLNIKVTGKKSFKTDQIQQQVVSALMDKYNPENAQIGGSVRLSDIYALIDNLSTVDYLHINKFYIRPWPKTIAGSHQLLIGSFSLTQATGSMDYYIQFKEYPGDILKYTIRSYKNGFSREATVIYSNSMSTTVINDNKNGFIFSLGIIDNNYSTGDRFYFTVSEPNKDYVEPGYNLPVFVNPNQLTLQVIETL